MRTIARALTAALLTLCTATGGFAAGNLVPRGASHAPIQIKNHHVNVALNNGFARTEVVQTFHSPNESALEALYSFPLPKSASLSEVTVRIGKREIQGEVLPKREARRVYDQEREQGHEAGLASKNGDRTLDFAVYPVGPNEDVVIRFVYYQPLEIDTGVGSYRYPFAQGGTDEAPESFRRANGHVAGMFSIDLELKTPWTVSDLRAPGFEHETTIRQVDVDRHELKLESLRASLDRDFVFYYELADNPPGRLELVTHRAEGDGPGTFMMVLTPGLDLQPPSGGPDADDILGQDLPAQGKTMPVSLHDAELEIRGVKTFDTTDGVIGKIDRGRQTTIFGRHEGGGTALVRLKARWAGEDKVYSAKIRIPEIDTDNPEIERMWALSRIVAIDAEVATGLTSNPTDSADAVRDLGVASQLVTAHTSMVVLADDRFEAHGIGRLNRERVRVEQAAQAIKANQPAFHTRVDSYRPMFSNNSSACGHAMGMGLPTGAPWSP